MPSESLASLSSQLIGHANVQKARNLSSTAILDAILDELVEVVPRVCPGKILSIRVRDIPRSVTFRSET